LEKEFQAGRTAYFAGKFMDAKVILDRLVAALEMVEGRDAIKGAAFLLAGAANEKVDIRDLSIKYYCRAKAILGDGRTIEGLDLKTLKHYGASCTGTSGAVTAVERSGGGGFFGGFFKFVLFAAITGGVVWYLFFSPNAPFKKKSGGSSSSGDSSTFTSSCFRTDWRVDIYSEWSGPAGDVNFSPSGTAPNPNQDNGWDNSVTYTVSTSGGGTLTLLRVRLSVTVSGGDTGRRHDLIYVDGGQILDQTNVFTESCSTPGSRDFANIYERNSTGSFTLRHKVELSKAAKLGTSVKVTGK
jgi:hypothetical protein